MGPVARRLLSRRVWRPFALVLVLAGALPLIAPGRGQAAGDPAPVPETPPARTELVGSASSRVAAAGPLVSGLSLEAGFATSTVDLAGAAARGESTTLSAGAANLFLSLAGMPPVLPDPTRADSSGTADAERSVVAPAGNFVRVGHEKAHAEAGRSEAATHLGDVAVGEAAAIVGGSSAATIAETGARSTSAVGELRLGGAGSAEVVLAGLVWWAQHGPGGPPEAAFSIGSASIGGQPLAVGSPEQIATAVAAINEALGPQGIRIQAPVVMTAADGGRVDPLRIELRDPPLNRAVGGAVYSPVAPTVNQAQEAATQATGSDPRFGQTLLAANLALALLLGNGGVGVEVGGAIAGFNRREVPDLGSLLGGSELPPLPGDGSGPDGSSFDPGTPGASGAFANGGSPLGDAAASGSYGSLPGAATSPDQPAAPGDGTATTPPAADVALGAGEAPGRRPDRPGHLPAPLAATALAAGLTIAGVDWLARRRTVGIVAGLRSAAGLGSAGARPRPGRRSVVTVGVAAVTLVALALAPSRVPIASGGADDLAAASPIPSAADGVPADTGASGLGDAAVVATGPGAAPTAGPGTRATSSGGGGVSGTDKGTERRTTAGQHSGTPGSTAGTGPGRTPGTAGAGTPGAVTRGRDCPGGDRQDKNSTYSPPCLHFNGDNGGVTSKGVTGDTITVAMREPESFDAGINNKERITDTPADLKRSILAHVDYFNRVYQTYGRKVQVVFYKPKMPLLAGVEGGHQEEANADALTVGQEIKAFADLTAAAPSYADALVRQGVIGFGTYHMSKSWYQARAPYAWANLPDCTWISEQSIDYVVKRLGRAPAKYAGDPAMRTKPRAIGLVVPDSPWYQECADHAEELYNAAGYRFARRVNYPLNFNQSSQTATNVVGQMKAAGVTTVMCMCDPFLPYFGTPQANQQDYHPEWLVAGFGATDTDIVGQFYDQAQWSHAFGMGVVGELRSGYDSESYRAHKAVRTDEPAQLRDIAYYQLLWFFTCAQMAGPNLNPKTLEAGCFALGPRQGELGLLKFGPGDYTAVSDAREIYWDPEATSPWNNRKGRYIATLGGQRFSGPWPEGEPAFPPPK